MALAEASGSDSPDFGLYSFHVLPAEIEQMARSFTIWMMKAIPICVFLDRGQFDRSN